MDRNKTLLSCYPSSLLHLVSPTLRYQKSLSGPHFHWSEWGQPCYRRKSRIQTSLSSSACRMGKTWHPWCRNFCSWRAESNWRSHWISRWPWSWGNLRNVRQHCHESSCALMVGQTLTVCRTGYATFLSHHNADHYFTKRSLWYVKLILPPKSVFSISCVNLTNAVTTLRYLLFKENYVRKPERFWWNLYRINSTVFFRIPAQFLVCPLLHKMIIVATLFWKLSTLELGIFEFLKFTSHHFVTKAIFTQVRPWHSI